MNRQAVKASRQAVKAQSCARGTQRMREAVNRRQSTLFNAVQRERSTWPFCMTNDWSPSKTCQNNSLKQCQRQQKQEVMIDSQ
jgi:hypothetical protein